MYKEIAKVLIISKILSQRLYNDGYISNDEREIINYGLNHLIMNFVGIGTILVIGLAFGKLEEALTMTFAIFPLRKYAGGFHADSPRICYLISSSIILCCFIIIDKIYTNNNILLVLGVLSTIIILLFSPVDCKNKRLDCMEKAEYKKRVVQIMFVEILVASISWFFYLEYIFGSILISWSIVSVAILVGKLKRDNL